MFCKIEKLFYGSVSLVREHLRGLRENRKHKIQLKESCKRRNSRGGRIVGGIKARSGKTFALSFYVYVQNDFGHVQIVLDRAANISICPN